MGDQQHNIILSMDFNNFSIIASSMTADNITSQGLSFFIFTLGIICVLLKVVSFTRVRNMNGRVLGLSR